MKQILLIVALFTLGCNSTPTARKKEFDPIDPIIAWKYVSTTNKELALSINMLKKSQPVINSSNIPEDAKAIYADVINDFQVYHDSVDSVIKSIIYAKETE